MTSVAVSLSDAVCQSVLPTGQRAAAVCQSVCPAAVWLPVTIPYAVSLLTSLKPIECVMMLLKVPL